MERVLEIRREAEVVDPEVGTCTPGRATLAGEHVYYTLERSARDPVAKCAPLGRYRLMLTPSDRARRGTLWTPIKAGESLAPADPNMAHRLPELLAVPGRSGIRVHALNWARQSVGCIGVGMERPTARSIGASRDALRDLCARLLRAEEDGDNWWVTIE